MGAAGYCRIYDAVVVMMMVRMMMTMAVMDRGRGERMIVMLDGAELNSTYSIL